MLQTCLIRLPEVSVMRRRIGWSEVVPVAHAIALPSEAVRSGAKIARQSWHDWLCYQLIVGLWNERYRRPALACYLPNSRPDDVFVVYLCTTSATASFRRVHAHLRDSAGVRESGSGYLPKEARPIVLWQPPAMMARLWPRPERQSDPNQRLLVDSGDLANYYSSPYDQEEVEFILGNPDNSPDYAVVPEEEHGVYLVDNQEYPYVNRFYRLSCGSDDPCENEAAEDLGSGVDAIDFK